METFLASCHEEALKVKIENVHVSLHIKDMSVCKLLSAVCVCVCVCESLRAGPGFYCVRLLNVVVVVVKTMFGSDPILFSVNVKSVGHP